MHSASLLHLGDRVQRDAATPQPDRAERRKEMPSTTQRLSQLSAEEKTEFRQMMAAFKGLTAFQAALAFNRLTPGTDWRQCTKGHMCEEWARRNHDFGRKALAAVTPERLAKAISGIKDKYGIE